MGDTIDTNSCNVWTKLSINHSDNENELNGKNEQGNILNNRSHIPRNLSEQEFFEESKPEGRVLVLYTGGTIGMVRNKNGGMCIHIY